MEHCQNMRLGNCSIIFIIFTITEIINTQKTLSHIYEPYKKQKYM